MHATLVRLADTFRHHIVSPTPVAGGFVVVCTHLAHELFAGMVLRNSSAVGDEIETKIFHAISRSNMPRILPFDFEIINFQNASSVNNFSYINIYRVFPK